MFQRKEVPPLSGRAAQDLTLLGPEYGGTILLRNVFTSRQDETFQNI
jgi:hypothetical protein